MQTNDIDQQSSSNLPRNRTLACLSKTAYERISPHLTRVELPQGTILVKPDQDIQWVYFLERGMGSMNSMDLAGTPVEVGIVGREGLIGVQSLLGQRRTRNSVTMQGAGEGLRGRAEVLRELTLADPELLQQVHTFLYAMLEQTTQLVLCNRLHELEGRLARWLLMTSNFMETNVIRLTQEFLAEMLGVGRPAVTITAGLLQRNGLITYSRGVVEILDKKGLQERACECYGIILQLYREVYPQLY